MDKSCRFLFQKPPALENIEQVFKRLYLERQQGEESEIPEEDREKIRSYLTGAVNLSGEYRHFGKGRDARREELHLSAFLETGRTLDERDRSGISVSIHPNYCPPNRHDHTFFEIVCVISGPCLNVTGSEQLELENGDILIMPPGTRHSLSVFTDDAFVVNIFVSPDVFEKTFFPMLDEQDILYTFFASVLCHYSENAFLLFRTGEDPVILALLSQLCSVVEENRHFCATTKTASLHGLFSRLLSDHEQDAEIFNPVMPEIHSNIPQILCYIQNHYRDCSLESVSGAFGYSGRHLQRLLGSYTGKSYSEIIQYLRLREAASLLAETDLSIDEIAERCGYHASRSLRKLFSDQYGMSPSAYRRKHI